MTISPAAAAKGLFVGGDSEFGNAALRLCLSGFLVLRLFFWLVFFWLVVTDPQKAVKLLLGVLSSIVFVLVVSVLACWVQPTVLAAPLVSPSKFTGSNLTLLSAGKEQPIGSLPVDQAIVVVNPFDADLLEDLAKCLSER